MNPFPIEFLVIPKFSGGVVSLQLGPLHSGGWRLAIAPVVSTLRLGKEGWREVGHVRNVTVLTFHLSAFVAVLICRRVFLSIWKESLVIHPTRSLALNVDPPRPQTSFLSLPPFVPFWNVSLSCPVSKRLPQVHSFQID